MRLHCFQICICLAFLPICLRPSALAADLKGSWKFSVDPDNGEHGDPVFVLKQTKDPRMGTYEGLSGHQKVTGNIKGDKVMLEVAASGFGQTLKLSYTGKLEGPDKMSGTMTRNIDGEITPGEWSATRSK
jgi:hypothetical protein